MNSHRESRKRKAGNHRAGIGVEPTWSAVALRTQELQQLRHPSHRFSTVRMAQHILVLEQGRVTEEGSHEELMALRGHYAEMFNTQADRYR